MRTIDLGEHVAELTSRILDLEVALEECESWLTAYAAFGDHGEVPFPLSVARRALRRNENTNTKGEGAWVR